MSKNIVAKGRSSSGRFLILFIALAALSISCSGTSPGFRWTALDGSSLAFSSRARLKGDEAALLGKGHPQEVYALKKGYRAPDASSLAIRIHSETGGAIIGLGWSGKDRKEGTPAKFSLAAGRTTFYLMLGKSTEVRAFSVKLEAPPGELPEKVARVESISFQPGFSGYENNAEGVRISDGIGILDNADGTSTWTLQPLSDGNEGTLIITYSDTPGSEIIARIGEGPSLRLGMGPGPKTMRLPLGFFPPIGLKGKVSVTVPDSTGITALNIRTENAEEARLMDPGLLLLSPELPEGDNYAWYRWDLRPDVLMFDFKSYEIQDRYLKRLAFFVEKKGFVGRLAPDSEIQPLHGWNAHDYKAEDVARFFTLASRTGFALNPEEEQFRDFLVDKKFILRSGKEFRPIKGAMISITKESPEYLRRTFLTHELSHAIFFSDENYMQFARGLWEGMEDEEKWFWILYFGWMNYNTSSSILMANEMQAYLAQQSIPQVTDYFTKILVERLLETHKELEEPIKIYMEKFASAFESRARQIDGWLKAKYGFGAGRLYFIR